MKFNLELCLDGISNIISNQSGLKTSYNLTDNSGVIEIFSKKLKLGSVTLKMDEREIFITQLTGVCNINEFDEVYQAIYKEVANLNSLNNP